MTAEQTHAEKLLKLRQIAGKSFRNAKRWYFAYLLCQLAILALTVVGIFIETDPSFAAVLAFIGVLSAEMLRWRSDYWKSEGEWAKRTMEISDGIGRSVESSDIADWLAAKPEGFLNDVERIEVQGSEFASSRPPGPMRVLENTQESAWWSKHLSRRMTAYLSFLFLILIACGFVTLTVSISEFENPAVLLKKHTPTQIVGGMICSALTFVFSVNLVRLLAEFVTFSNEAGKVLHKCSILLKARRVTESDVLTLLHEYQTARNVAPLIPTFLWKVHGDHLRKQWQDFRQK